MKLNRPTLLTVGLTLVIGVALGAIFFGGNNAPAPTAENHEHELDANGSWTCSMHPQVRQSEPGACPFCGMDLIPVAEGENDNPTILKMSNNAVQLANIQTAKVESTIEDDILRLSGKVKVDDRRVNVQTTHFGGRVEALYKSFEGDLVRKGEKVASIYSPELVSAQEELIEAKKLEATNPVLLDAARRKLHHWKLTMGQIQAIESSKEPIRNFDLLADYDGVITKKLVNTGNHLHEGGGLMEITDLTKVWAVFEVYEKDLGKIQLGDRFDFENKATGKFHLGTISFISPEVNPRTRVIEVRADLDNRSGDLKPGMFISTNIFVTGNGGISVPKSAVLWTGKRSIVYVKIPGEQSFQLREVMLGDVVDDKYFVKDGLIEGEEVVTNGAFTLDAEAQLRGKISMMNTAASTSIVQTSADQFVEVELSAARDYSDQVTPVFQEQLTELSKEYIILKDLMVEGVGAKIRKAGVRVKNALDNVDMKLTKGEAHLHWMDLLNPIEESLAIITATGDRDKQRLNFINLSKALINAIESFGTSFDNPLYIQFCPMANNDKGATWISLDENIVNPYFGDVMLSCGNVENIIEGR